MTEIVIPRANLLVNGEWFANGDHVETAGITVERASSGGGGEVVGADIQRKSSGE